ncbi:hypothetical protein BB558_000284 [Smittium angustum]|uniref:Peptidase S1 domain-containing protein n=1 Tax=Smittium angustum TaxID=133377 RepID=A0A2U1JET9_SMIAN|nr:hypothetical protein BB558_000284 [Smittium angustum]
MRLFSTVLTLTTPLQIYALSTENTIQRHDLDVVNAPKRFLKPYIYNSAKPNIKHKIRPALLKRKDKKQNKDEKKNEKEEKKDKKKKKNKKSRDKDESATGKMRIIGGVDAETGLRQNLFGYPFTVMVTDLTTGIICGGSLISDMWIVTAAHCLAESALSDVRVLVGSKTINDRLGIPKPLTTIQKGYIHKDYNTDTQLNDICVIKLSKPVNIRPVKIDTRPIGDDMPLRALGWGITHNESSSPSNTLKQVDLRTVSKAECQRRYTIFAGNGIGTQICTGNTPGKDTCLGDSGGPLIRQLDPTGDNWALVGLTSFGAWLNNSKTMGVCGSDDVVGVYTNVYKHIGFITAATNLTRSQITI